MHLSWRVGEHPVSLRVPVRIHEHCFERHVPLSRVLSQTPAPENSSLGLLRQLYDIDEPASPQPVPEVIVRLPGRDTCLWYQLIALEAPALEQAIHRLGDTDFTLEPLLVALCRRYGCELEETFPARTTEVANRPVQDSGFVMQVAQIDEGDPLQDNEALLQHAQSLYEPKKKKRRRLATPSDPTNLDSTTYATQGRLVPVMMIPLLLATLPNAYQCCNNTLQVCLDLEARVGRTISFSGRPSYMRDQAWALRANCLYQAALTQRATHKQHATDPNPDPEPNPHPNPNPNPEPNPVPDPNPDADGAPRVGIIRHRPRDAGY